MDNFVLFAYISQNIMDNSVPFVYNPKLDQVNCANSALKAVQNGEK